MLRDFFESLKIELAGIFPNIQVGIPYTAKEVMGQTKGITIYITFVNIEKIEKKANAGGINSIATIRVLFTAFIKDEELQDEVVQMDALGALDNIITYLDNNKRSYNLIATTENGTSNIWSAFRIPLRPCLVYECAVNLTPNLSA
jgi:hypothetical protein